MWVLVKLIAFVVHCGALATELPSGQKECLDEPTSLLQTSAVQTRVWLSPSQANARISSGKPRSNSTGVKHARAAPAKPHVYSAAPPLPSVYVTFGKVLTVTAASLMALLVVFAMCGNLQGCLPQSKQMTGDELEVLRNSWGPWLLICSYMAVQTMMTDQYLPSLAQMGADFGATPLTMSCTLPVNWLVKAFSALAMAGLADTYGRKPLFVLCTVLTAVGSLACACAPSAAWFIGGRILQGISEGGEPIFAMLACDMMEDTDERMSYTSSIFAVLPVLAAVAPLIGGVTAHFSNWRVPFVALAGWGFINAVCAPFLFVETRPSNPQRASSLGYNAEFRRVFYDRHICFLAFLQGAAMMVIFSVDVNLSLILARWFHQDEIQIALKLALIAAIFLVLGRVPGFLCQQFGAVKVLQFAMVFAIIPIVACGVLGSLPRAIDHFWILLVCVGLVQGFCISCTILGNTLYFQPVEEVSRAAAGINTFLTMLFCAVGTFASSTIQSGSDHALFHNFLNWLALTVLVIFITFWPCFGLKPPEWACVADDFEDEKQIDDKGMDDMKKPKPQQSEDAVEARPSTVSRTYSIWSAVQSYVRNVFASRVRQANPGV